MNNQNNPKMDTNQKNQFSEGFLYVRRGLSFENNNEKVILFVEEENYEKYDKYLLGMIDREEHLNQSLRYQFYCEDLDFNYTVFYDNKVGFEFGEYLKGDVNEIGKLLGPITLHERLVIIKNELMSTGSISEESILLTDIVFTMFVKTQIIPTLKTILLKNKGCIKHPISLFSNPSKELSDYVIRLGKNPNGGYYLKMREEDLMNLSMMTNVMSK